MATLLVGGSMALQGTISAQQLTAFVMYVEFVTSASLSVCDQWVGLPTSPSDCMSGPTRIWSDFVMYVEFVTSASLSICDLWVGFAYQPTRGCTAPMSV